MPHSKRPAVIDIGSNSVRLVIYEDFSPATSVFYNEKFSCKLGRFTKDGMLMDKAKTNTTKALQRFRKICDANNVISVRAIATAAMRDAKDGHEFSQELSQKTGFNIEIISGDDEAYYAAMGVGHKIPSSEGCVGDLGGGSLELANLLRGCVSDNKVSLPLGVLRLQNDIDDDFQKKLYEKHIDNILDAIQFDSQNQKNFYAVGGSWRALINFYMIANDIHLHILQGFTISANTLKTFITDILDERIKISDYAVSHISKRRLSAIPIAGLILLKLIDKFGFEKIIISVSGLREGVLINMLPFKRDYESSALAFAISESDMRARNPLLFQHFLAHIKQILPNTSNRFVLLAEIITYLSDVAYRRHVDFRADYVFDFVLFSNLDDLTHNERVLIALCVAWRYEPDFQIPTKFLDYIKGEENNIYWGRTVALALRYLYSITGISHLVAADLKFIRYTNSLEIISLSNKFDNVFPEGETSEKRFSALIKHLFD